jgi:hypothetical protein
MYPRHVCGCGRYVSQAHTAARRVGHTHNTEHKRLERQVSAGQAAGRVASHVRARAASVFYKLYNYTPE